MPGKNVAGFTIPELLIATAVFSVVLMATMVIFFLIGNIFFKGVTLTATQQSAKKIQDSLAADINTASSTFDSSEVPTSHTDGNVPTAHTAKYICVGNIRYTYYIDKEVNGNPNLDNNFGLVRDTPQTCVGSDPYSGAAPNYGFVNPEQMVGGKTRLTDFSIDRIGSFDYWDVDITLAYGDNDVLNDPSDSHYPTCKQGLKFSQFCSTTSLSTSVSRRL